MLFNVREINKDIAISFIEEHHYTPMLPKLTKHWLGGFVEDELVAVLTLGWGTQPKQTIKKLFPHLDTKDLIPQRWYKHHNDPTPIPPEV